MLSGMATTLNERKTLLSWLASFDLEQNCLGLSIWQPLLLENFYLMGTFYWKQSSFWNFVHTSSQGLSQKIVLCKIRIIPCFQNKILMLRDGKGPTTIKWKNQSLIPCAPVFIAHSLHINPHWFSYPAWHSSWRGKDVWCLRVFNIHEISALAFQGKEGQGSMYPACRSYPITFQTFELGLCESYYCPLSQEKFARPGLLETSLLISRSKKPKESSSSPLNILWKE